MKITIIGLLLLTNICAFAGCDLGHVISLEIQNWEEEQIFNDHRTDSYSLKHVSSDKNDNGDDQLTYISTRIISWYKYPQSYKFLTKQLLVEEELVIDYSLRDNCEGTPIRSRIVGKEHTY